MKEEKAVLEFDELSLIQNVINQYNWRYSKTSRRCEVNSNKLGRHEISIIDDGKLVPFGIFDLGYSIGVKWMNENYRIELTGWYKKFHKTIHEEKKHPKNEEISIELKGDTKINLKIKKATLPNSNISTIKPYLHQRDFTQISNLSEFKILPNLKTKIFQTKNNLNLNYVTKDNYLFIFGTDLRSGKDYYKIDLESVFEIKRPDYDF